ncbi:F-box protein, partial [Trifolium medium]|nr:F-box protein [Trifolium medium]
VVDRFGTTFTVRPDSTVELVAEHVDFGGDRKLLVESEGELLLVDMHESSRLRIDVFKLCEREKKWMKLKNLARKVLFLGHGCSFSASTLDLCVSKGNCVIFIDDAFLSVMNLLHGKCVFHLDQGRLSPMSHYPEYFNLFWPPPDWIFKS